MKPLLIFLFLIYFSGSLFAHSPEGMFGVTAGAKSVFNGNYYGFGADINATVYAYNAGISQDFIVKNSPRTSLYIGMGIVNMLQVQYGYNFHSSLLRFRTELPVFNGFTLWTYDISKDFKKRINLTFSYEICYKDRNRNQFGLGLSILL